MTSRARTTVFAVVVLGILEALTFYAYSFLFMIEGQPSRHGDPALRAWAWVLLTAMVLEPLAAFCWILWARKRRSRDEV